MNKCIQQVVPNLLEWSHTPQWQLAAMDVTTESEEEMISFWKFCIDTIQNVNTEDEKATAMEKLIQHTGLSQKAEEAAETAAEAAIAKVESVDSKEEEQASPEKKSSIIVGKDFHTHWFSVVHGKTLSSGQCNKVHMFMMSAQAEFCKWISTHQNLTGVMITGNNGSAPLYSEKISKDICMPYYGRLMIATEKEIETMGMLTMRFATAYGCKFWIVCHPDDTEVPMVSHAFPCGRDE